MRTRLIALSPLAMLGCGQPLGEELFVIGPDMGWEATGKADTTCGGGGGTYTTIQAAINAAASGATITVCAGTYKERLTVPGKNLTLKGTSGATLTILDANASGTALTLTGGAKVAMSGFTIKGAKASGVKCTDSTLNLYNSTVTGNSGSSGAGLYALRCTLGITTVAFTSNAASSKGAGLYAESTTGWVKTSTFTSNKASSKGGGAYVLDGNFLVTTSTFTSNAATHGGGLYLSADSDVTDNTFTTNSVTYHGAGVYGSAADGDFTGNAFNDNHAGEDGGGLYLDVSAAYVGDNDFVGNDAVDDGGGLRTLTSTATIDGNYFEANVATDSGGGAKMSHKYGVFSDNTLIDNVAGTTGGGLYLDEDTTPISGCTFDGNAAVSGGGLYQSGGWRLTEVSDSTFTGNTATSNGGGIGVQTSAYGVQVTQSNLTLNTAKYGGALYSSDSKLILKNSNVYRNSGSTQGGGLWVSNGSTELVNWVAYRNSSASGAGLWVSAATGTGVKNAVFYKNETGIAVVIASGTLTWKYNDHYGQTAGDFSGMSSPTGTNGNININPALTDASNGNFTLLSTSTLKNAGDPTLFDVDGSRSDIGAYGGAGGAW